MKQYLYLGFYADQEDLEMIETFDQYPMIQTIKFSSSLINSLEESKKIRCRYLTFLPISDFPFFSKKIVPKKRYTSNENIEYIISMPFVNTPIFKILSRFLVVNYYTVKELISRKYDGIVVYSLHSPLLVTGLIYSKIFKKKLVGIWTDPPSLKISRESRLKSFLKNFEKRTTLFLMRFYRKNIVLTKYLSLDFSPKSKYLVIEGLLDQKPYSNKIEFDVKSNSKTVYLYSGSLSTAYGIKELVTSFMNHTNDKIELHLYGVGNYESEIQKLSMMSDKIKYFGFKTNQIVLEAQRNADFLVNVRSPQETFVKYSFPSKTIEYMNSGTPLITTILPGFPAEYEQFVISLKTNTVRDISSAIDKSLLMTVDERNSLGIAAYDFIQKKSYLTRSKEIEDFLYEQ